MDTEGLLKPWLPNQQKANCAPVKLLERMSDCDFLRGPVFCWINVNCFVCRV